MNQTDGNETATDIRGGKRSASGAERWINCPGSFLMEKKFPEEQAQEWTNQGTDIAEAMETGDTNHLFSKYDEAVADELATIAEQLQAMELKALDEWKTRHGIEATPERWAEIRYWMRDRGGITPIVSAQIDVGYYDPFTKQILIIDDKSGFLDPTTAALNFQLLTQMCCISEDIELNGATVAIAHARIRARYSEAYYEPEQIISGREMIHNAVIAGNDPHAPRYPGEWCRYCKAKSGCKEAQAWLLIDLIVMHAQPCGQCGSHFALLNSKEGIQVATSELGLEHLAAIFKKISIGTKLWDAVKARLKQCSDDELLELGLKRVGTGQTRTITSKEKAKELLLSILSSKEFDDACKVSVGDLEKAVKVATGWPLKQAQGEVNRILDPVIERKDKSPTIKALK
jgi:hypothetical protein